MPVDVHAWPRASLQVQLIQQPQVAELTFQGVLEDRFFLMTHPSITLKRIDDRHEELRGAISEQPTTGF